MSDLSEKETGRLSEAARYLQAAKERLPVLRSLAWDRSLADDFFAQGERTLPRPVYPQIDITPSLEGVMAARALIDGSSLAHHWLQRVADTVEETAAMIDCIATPLFHGHSRALYGSPTAPIADGSTTALNLATRLDELLSEFEDAPGLMAADRLTAEDVKIALDHQLPEHFGDEAPRVEITMNVSAKAAAGSDYIKLREDAAFSDLDVTQLLQHEALVHIATGFNGRRQHAFPILAESHPGNTRTQEGLAVFAEFISGALDPRRFRRLADRVIAINMAADGADFIEIYQFFREKNDRDTPFEAFESARRVMRGGLVEGGCPFTKDSVYLSGLLDVHNYLRGAVKIGSVTSMQLVFVGKIDLTDIAAMEYLYGEGLIAPPAFLPPWARDPRYLVSYLAYSTFLNGIDLAAVTERFAPQIV